MDTQILASGLCFGEGPRWRNNQLWFSDMHAHYVMQVSHTGKLEPVIEVENRPSGLGWMPNGDLLIVSMMDRKLLRWDGAELTTHAELDSLASFHCNDMVVDSSGRAYVGNFGSELVPGNIPAPAELICVEPDGEARVVADDLIFPNGCVITPTTDTMIVAETFAARLTAFDILPNGDLTNRRIWAQLPEGAVPDGICLDSDGGIWSASPTTNECIRQLQGGEITHRVSVDQGAYACMLGGASGDTLFVLTAASSDPIACTETRSGRIETCQAPYPRAGLP